MPQGPETTLRASKHEANQWPARVLLVVDRPTPVEQIVKCREDSPICDVRIPR
jgi:hypothetical protein